MPRVPPVTNATRAMSNPSLTLPASTLQTNRRRTCLAVCLNTISADDILVSGSCPRGTCFSFRLCDTFDGHQEQNARQRCRAFLVHYGAVAKNVRFAISAGFLVACDAHGDAHAATDAQGGKALLGVALLHFMQQRHQH